MRLIVETHREFDAKREDATAAVAVVLGCITVLTRMVCSRSVARTSSAIPDRQGRKVVYMCSRRLVRFWSCIALAALACRHDPSPSVSDIQASAETLSPKVIELANFPVVKQPNPYTCGIATATILSNYLHHRNETPDDLIARYRVPIDHGTMPDTLIRWLSAELPGYSFMLYRNVGNLSLLREIHASLLDGVPVIVSFGAPNPFDAPHYDFHYSAVYGLNLVNRTISISNPYGYTETISLSDFQKRMLFSELDRYPAFHRRVIEAKAIDKNEFILVKKAETEADRSSPAENQ